MFIMIQSIYKKNDAVYVNLFLLLHDGRFSGTHLLFRHSISK